MIGGKKVGGMGHEPSPEQSGGGCPYQNGGKKRRKSSKKSERESLERSRPEREKQQRNHSWLVCSNFRKHL